MFVIGLTGSLASGKTTVSEMLMKRGSLVVSADQIVAELMLYDTSTQKAVAKNFGDSVLLESGAVDKAALARIVFTKKNQLKKLESILHPKVRQRIKHILTTVQKYKKYKVVVLEVPLLYEAGFERMADVVVAVNCPQYQQLERIKVSGKMSQAEALRRIRSQMTLKEKCERADFVIENNESLAETRQQIKNIWKNISKNF
jgi:dephospho-CoA kinase